MVLGEVIAVKAVLLDPFDQAQPLLEELAERQAVAVEMIENAEFKHGRGLSVKVGRLGSVGEH
jgi:hypothetical protein